MKTNNNILAALIFLFALGCLWGIAEFASGTFIKNLYPGGVTGSLLIGLGFFFLSASYFFRKKISSVVFILAITVLFKIIATILLGKSLSDPWFINPVLSLMLAAGLFLLFNRSLPGHKASSHLVLFLSGAFLASLTAILFPYLSLACGRSFSFLNGASVPLSVEYLHLSAIVGFFAYPAGVFLASGITSLLLRRIATN